MAHARWAVLAVMLLCSTGTRRSLNSLDGHEETNDAADVAATAPSIHGREARPSIHDREARAAPPKVVLHKATASEEKLRHHHQESRHHQEVPLAGAPQESLLQKLKHLAAASLASIRQEKPKAKAEQEAQSGSVLLQFVGVLFAVASLALFGKVRVLDYPKTDVLLKKRSKVVKETQKFYKEEVEEIEDKISELRHTSAWQTEVLFLKNNSLFDAFLENLRKVKALKDAKTPLKAPIRAFMLQWLKAFEGCSVDPEERPEILVPLHKIPTAETVHELAKLILDESDGQMVQDAGSDVDKAQELHDEIHTAVEWIEQAGPKGWVELQQEFFGFDNQPTNGEPFPCEVRVPFLKFKLISQFHAMLLGGFCGGLLLALLLHATKSHKIGILVDVALGTVYMMLNNTETMVVMDRFKVEHTQVKEDRESVQKTTQVLQGWLESYENIGTYWAYHVRNRLDLFSAIGTYYLSLLSQDVSTNEKAILEKITKTNMQLEGLIAGLGDVRFHEMGLQHGREKVLDSARKQVGANIERLHKAAVSGNHQEVEQRLDNFFGMLIVFVDKCEKLQNTDEGFFSYSGDLTDPFVIIRVGEMAQNNAPRTEVKRDNLNPVFKQEFLIDTLPLGAKTFSLDVMDCDEDRYTGEGSEGVCFLSVNFASHPGQWIQKEENLLDWQKKAKSKSTILYAFFYANSMASLAYLPGHGIGATASMDLSSFLG